MGVTKEELQLILSAKDRMSGVLRKNRKALDMMLGLAKGVGLVFAAWRVAKTAMAIGRMGAEVERLNISFRRLSGAAPDQMLNELRKASRGTISDMGLMLSANRAMMLGVTKDAKTMARLTEIAIARGQALGVSAQQSFDNIVTGIGRMSPLILDNLGILTGGKRVFDEYAASIGKSADALTDLEKRQALLNRVLEDTIEFLPDAASQGERLTAAYANLKDSLTVLVADPYGDLMEVVAEELELWTRAIKLVTGAGAAYEGLNVFLRAHIDLVEDLPSAYDQAVSALSGLIDDLRAAGWKTLQERRMGATPWDWISLDDIQEAQRLYGLDKAAMIDYLSEMAYLRKDAAAAQDKLDAEAIRKTEAHGRAE